MNPQYSVQLCSPLRTVLRWQRESSAVMAPDKVTASSFFQHNLAYRLVDRCIDGITVMKRWQCSNIFRLSQILNDQDDPSRRRACHHPLILDNKPVICRTRCNDRPTPREGVKTERLCCSEYIEGWISSSGRQSTDSETITHHTGATGTSRAGKVQNSDAFLTQWVTFLFPRLSVLKKVVCNNYRPGDDI